MAWGLDKNKVRSQWDEWSAFRKVAVGDEPAGLEDMFRRPFRRPSSGDEAIPEDLLGPAERRTSPGDDFMLDPAPGAEVRYALTLLAQLAEIGVLSDREFGALQRRVRGY